MTTRDVYAWPNPTDGMPIHLIQLIRSVGRAVRLRRSLHRVYGPSRGAVEHWTRDRADDLRVLAGRVRRVLDSVGPSRRPQILAALAQEVVR